MHRGFKLVDKSEFWTFARTVIANGGRCELTEAQSAEGSGYAQYFDARGRLVSYASYRTYHTTPRKREVITNHYIIRTNEETSK